MRLKTNKISNIVGRCSFCKREQFVTYLATMDRNVIIDVSNCRVNFELKDVTPEGSIQRYYACPNCIEKTTFI